MLFLSINVIKVKIPGLDYYLNGGKRSWLPLGARFGTIMAKKWFLSDVPAPMKSDIEKAPERVRSGAFVIPNRFLSLRMVTQIINLFIININWTMIIINNAC